MRPSSSERSTNRSLRSVVRAGVAVLIRSEVGCRRNQMDNIYRPAIYFVLKAIFPPLFGPDLKHIVDLNSF